MGLTSVTQENLLICLLVTLRLTPLAVNNISVSKRELAAVLQSTMRVGLTFLAM